MNKIRIIGLGPGHEDYVLPIAKKMIEESDIIFGGKRQLDMVSDLSKTRVLKMPLEDIVLEMKHLQEKNSIGVIVSGDTGFYSFLDFIKKHFRDDELEVIPGISSLQYFFAKLKMSHWHAYVGSVHGRTLDLVSVLKNNKTVGLLTDHKMTPNQIVKLLKDNHYKGKIHIGENLSYENESIESVSIEDYQDKTFSSLCVVVINHE